MGQFSLRWCNAWSEQNSIQDFLFLWSWEASVYRNNFVNVWKVSFERVRRSRDFFVALKREQVFPVSDEAHKSTPEFLVRPVLFTGEKIRGFLVQEISVFVNVRIEPMVKSFTIGGMQCLGESKQHNTRLGLRILGGATGD